MNQIFEKLGIYDLVVLVLSGTIIVSTSIWIGSSILNFEWIKLEWITQLKTEGTILFLLISYVVGIVFQELGSLWYRNVRNQKGILLKEIFEQTDGPEGHWKLSAEEVKAINENLGKIINTTDRDSIYNYCKFYLINNSKMSREDRNQATAGISRSLALYSAILCFVFVVSIFANTKDYMEYIIYHAQNANFYRLNDSYSLIASVQALKINLIYMLNAMLCFAIAILLDSRCVRFTKIRYINILRTAYYGILEDKKFSTNDDNNKKDGCPCNLSNDVINIRIERKK